MRKAFFLSLLFLLGGCDPYMQMADSSMGTTFPPPVTNPSMDEPLPDTQFSHSGFGLDSRQRARIVDNFKRHHKVAIESILPYKSCRFEVLLDLWQDELLDEGSYQEFSLYLDRLRQGGVYLPPEFKGMAHLARERQRQEAEARRERLAREREDRFYNEWRRHRF